MTEEEILSVEAVIRMRASHSASLVASNQYIDAEVTPSIAIGIHFRSVHSSGATVRRIQAGAFTFDSCDFCAAAF